MILSTILEEAPDYETAKKALLESSLANSNWKIERWQPDMLETARLIARKWRKGFYS